MTAGLESRRAAGRDRPAGQGQHDGDRHVKTPKTTTGGDSPATLDAATPTPEIRRIPAHVGTIGSTDAGEGTPAQAGQPGEVTPAASTLVGDPAMGAPAAQAKPRPGDKPADRAPSTPTPAPTPAAARKGGFWPLAFGGAVAAGLGAAATIYALPQLPAGWLPQATATATDGPAIDEAALMQAASDAGRDAAEEVLAAAPDAAPAELPADLLARIDALEQQAATPTDDTPADGASAAPDGLAALQQRLDDQQARLDELEARPAFDPQATEQARQQIETTAAEVRETLDAARSEAQQLQDEAAESTRRAQAVAAVASLQSALDAGVTPDQARDTLEGAGIQTPEALQAEIPSLTTLQSGFAEAARASLRASLQQQAAQGQGNVLTNFLRAQTGARSTAPREGDDPDAVLSRAGADVQAGRITDAVTLIGTLPEPALAAPAMADWLTGATAYSRAQAALSDLSSGTN